jgi:hypothetical protein
MKKRFYVDINHLNSMLAEVGRNKMLDFLNKQDIIIAMDSDSKNFLKDLEKEINTKTDGE